MTEGSVSQSIATLPVRQELARSVRLLDVRPAEKFASRHVRGTLNIDLRGRFAAWAALLIRPTERLWLIGENAKAAEEARGRLARVGLTLLAGYSRFDERQWLSAGFELARVPVLYCRDVGLGLREPDLHLIDARSRAEWLQGHLPTATAMPLLELVSGTAQIDPSRRSFVYCLEGFRATTAASILLQRGFRNVGVLFDGVEGWRALGRPLQKPALPPRAPVP